MKMQMSVVGVAIVLLVGACAPTAQRGLDGPQASATTTLTVNNDNWLDVAVYLVRGTTRTRLGSVSSMSKGEFAIPRAYVVGISDLMVQAEPLGSQESYVSPPIQVFPGAQVELTLANRLALSHFAVYARN